MAGIMIAPDEVYKAGEGDGDAFKIEVPNLGADGELINEAHKAYFVEYLRVVFRFAGFPGYDGIESVPPNWRSLARDLSRSDPRRARTVSSMGCRFRRARRHSDNRKVSRLPATNTRPGQRRRWN
jgi:hypothetical protein